MNRRQMIAAVFALPVAAAAAALPRREGDFTTANLRYRYREARQFTILHESNTQWYAPPGEYTYYRRQWYGAEGVYVHPRLRLTDEQLRGAMVHCPVDRPAMYVVHRDFYKRVDWIPASWPAGERLDGRECFYLPPPR